MAYVDAALKRLRDAEKPRKAKKRNETALVKAAIDFLTMKGAMCWRNNTTGVFDPTRKTFRTFTGRKGVADILGIWKGKPLAVECKMKGNKLSPDQQSFITEFKTAGGLAIVAYDLDDIDAGLKEQQ